MVCLVLISPGTAVGQASPAVDSSGRDAERGHGVERERRRCGDRGLYGTVVRPVPRVAPVRHDAHRRPRRAQRDPAPLPAVCSGPARTESASPEAAVAAAAHDVLVPLVTQHAFPNCLAASLAGVEADYTAALGAIPDGLAKTQGVAVGQAAAAQILAQRSSDGSDTPYLDSVLPAGHPARPVPVHGPLQLRRRARLGERHAVRAQGQRPVPPGPPYLVTGKNYAADLNEVKALGGDGTTTPSNRTPDQTEIALFWVGTSASQWNRITRTVADTAGLDLWATARLFALLDIAMVDGVIASWDTRYLYNHWRPITAIREC